MGLKMKNVFKGKIDKSTREERVKKCLLMVPRVLLCPINNLLSLH